MRLRSLHPLCSPQQVGIVNLAYLFFICNSILILFLPSTVAESFSNESLRSREGEGSSDASIVRLGIRSEIWEPERKSRLLSDNVITHWQREISEPDVVTGRDGTISTAFCESTSSSDNVIANSELVVVQESPKVSIIPMVEEVFSQDVHEPVKPMAVSESSKNDITLPVEMVFSLAADGIVKTEASEGANCIKECRITASSCSATAASELITAIENSYEDNATLPVEKLPSLDLCELTEGVAGGETIAINENDMTTSTCKVTAASELVLAEDNGTVPMKKRSTPDLRESINGVGIHDTTLVDTSEITTITCNVTATSETAEDKTEDETTSKDESESAASINDIIAASQVLFAVDGSAEEMTLLAENVSPLNAFKPAEAISTDETSITTESNEAVSEVLQVLFAVDWSAEEITLLAEKVPPLRALKPAGAIPIDESPITDASDDDVSEAPLNDIIAASQVLFAVDGSAEEMTLLAENVSPLNAFKPAEAISTDETSITTESNEAVSEAPRVLFAVDRSAEEITLLPEKVSPLHALKPAGAIPIEETPITDVSDDEVSEAPQVFFAINGSTEEITLPAEKVSFLEALKPAEAIPTDETPITDESDEDVREAPEVVYEVNGSTEEVTLPVEKVSSLDALKPAEAIPTYETPISDESDEAVSAATSGSYAVDRSTEEITLPAKNGSSLDALKTAEAIGTDETTGDLIFMNDIKINKSSC